MPRVFISYSWDDEDHKRWVRDLAARLRAHGVDTLLDQWHLVPGDQLPAFMETAIRESDFVLVICTPGCKTRSDSRAGGVGYEGDIITGEIFGSRNHRKFIPLLARGAWLAAAPSWLQGKYFLDFTQKPALDEAYQDLLRTLLGQRSPAPPVDAPVALGPEVSLRALFGNQDAISISPASFEPDLGYGEFTWPAVYELHNMGRERVTVLNIENLFPSVKVKDHEFILHQRSDPEPLIVLYNNFAEVLGRPPDAGVNDRLPLTIDAAAKVYLRIFLSYLVVIDLRQVFSKDEEHFYKLLTAALGSDLNSDGSRPAVVKTFLTRLTLHEHGSIISEQRAILLTVGCKIDFKSMFEHVRFPQAT